jgi:hypothetical protein
MSANLMVRPCSCPARDTLCIGGQMLSMSQMGQSEKSSRPTGKSALPLKTDIVRSGRHVSNVPRADIAKRIAAS